MFAALVLFLLPLGESPSGPSAVRIVADARLAAVGASHGRAAEAKAAEGRIGDLERAVAAHWGDAPDGPRTQLTALILAHAAAAEATLLPLLGPAALADLRAVRDRCHAIGQTKLLPDEPNVEFLAALSRDRPGFYEAFNAAPSVRAVFLAAISRPGRPVRFDPTEPDIASAMTVPGKEAVWIRLARRLETAAGGRPWLAAVLFEAFNTHLRSAGQVLWTAAGGGTLDRDGYAEATAATEQLSAANVLRVLRDHFAELAAADLARAPGDWLVPGFGVFLPRPPGLRLELVEYPYFPYAALHDRRRFYVGFDAGSNLWETAVLWDRIRYYGRIPPEWTLLAEGDARLNEMGAGDVWFQLHQTLPAGARRRLCELRGGEAIERVCRAGWAAVAAAAAVPRTFPF